MRAILIMATVPMLLLASCGKQVSEENASVEEVAAKVREANGGDGFVRPGEWESKVVIEEFSIPGMPPEAVARMKTMTAQNRQQNFKSCLTPEDVKQPKGKFFTGNDDCRYDHFRMGGGKIDAKLRCPSAQGMTQVMTMAGTYSPDKYSMQMTMKGEGAEGAAAGMTMKMRVDSLRTGDCSPATVAAKE